MLHDKRSSQVHRLVRYKIVEINEASPLHLTGKKSYEKRRALTPPLTTYTFSHRLPIDVFVRSSVLFFSSSFHGVPYLAKRRRGFVSSEQCAPLSPETVPKQLNLLHRSTATILSQLSVRVSGLPAVTRLLKRRMYDSHMLNVLIHLFFFQP